MTAVVERLEPEELFHWFLGQRAAMGLTGVPLGGGSSVALIRALKNNELAGLVSDRDLVGNGVEVEFFGEKTTLPAGAATLALRTGAPLIPVVVYSGPGNWHTGVVHAPIDTTRQGTLRQGRRPGDPGARHGVRARHPLPARAMAPVSAQLAERSAMSQSGAYADEGRHAFAVRADPARCGVQGQVVGLARSLRDAGSRGDGPCPLDEEGSVPDAVGDHIDIGRPTALHSNGSVAPVALWPSRVGPGRARRPDGSASTCCTCTSPWRRWPPTGWCSPRRCPWSARTTGPASAGGCPFSSRWPNWSDGACRSAWPSQRRPARRGCARAAGEFEVLFNGVDMDSLRVGQACPRRARTANGVVPGRHEERKGLNVLLDAFDSLDRPAVLWISGDGPGSEVQHRRHPESDRVHWLGMVSDEEVVSRLAGAQRAVRAVAPGESFGMVLLEGMAAGCAVVASDIEGYRKAAGGHAALVPPGDVGALSRALGVALADAVEGSGQSSPESRKAEVEYAGSGRWTPWPSATRRVPACHRRVPAARRP